MTFLVSFFGVFQQVHGKFPRQISADLNFRDPIVV